MKRALRISMITPSYQQVDYLEECLRSVADQQGVEVEHILVDGGSTDGSRALIERHARGLAWWCSEKDGGQSDAINKGLAHATGDVVNWLNSDDALLPGALRRVADAFASDPGLRVFGGCVVHRRGTADRPFERINDMTRIEELYTDPVINQPATFHRMDVVRAAGGVDPGLRYVMDLALWWDLLFRHGTTGLRFEPVELAVFRLHEESKTMTSMPAFLDETASLLHQLAEDVGASEWCGVLNSLHDLRSGLRRIPVRKEHAGIVIRMATRFVLKWHGSIHQRREFEAMREVVPLVDPRDPWERARLDGLLDQLRAGSWPAFRLRRKLKHLRG
ncbi:MAG: glycosyltransferase [Flavobacteriales bacterium]|nr:glycosyltransferase [Flavobacteriales bacterium]MCB9193631.1 glycosyltransferase [Flavobacteriales bacterium]